MITFSNVSQPDGTLTTLTVPSPETKTIDASGLLVLPGLIDPHVHFRTPGLEHKENWITASRAALRGGYTTVFDMPNTLPPTITANALTCKKHLIDTQLREAGIPLRYQLFFGADRHHLDEIEKVKSEVIGIKVFMGCSTGNLVIDDEESLQAVFELGARFGLMVAVHAEDEALIKARRTQFSGRTDYACHSEIRSPEVAAIAVEKAIALSKRFGTRLYILHVSTLDEIALIRQAKKAGLLVFAETTPHHLFLDTTAYAILHGKALVNPPLRSRAHREALWDAIREGVIDTIGSDHAPHTLDEKSEPYGRCPSGMPGIETTLPLLLTASREGLLDLAQVIRLTAERPREIFGIPPTTDFVLVDCERGRKVQDRELATRCHWSAYAGRTLYGWPVYVTLRNKGYDLTCVAFSSNKKS